MTTLRNDAFPALSLGLAGALAECCALEALLDGSLEESAVAHLAGALAAAAGSALAASWRAPSAARQAVLGSFVLALSLPFAGLIALFALAVPAWGGAAARASVPPPLVLRSAPRHGARGRSSAHAPVGPVPSLSPKAPLEQRVAATRRLRRMEAERAIPLLKRALSDPAEEVRLLAHAILERRERQIRAALSANLRRLDELCAAGASAATRAGIHAELAGQHWELCRNGFVGGESKRRVLRRAARHGQAAWRSTRASEAIAIAVRAHLALRQFAQAEAALQLAAQRGLTRAQLAPLSAELAFAARRFRGVGPALGGLPRLAQRQPELAQVVRFWTGGLPS